MFTEEKKESWFCVSIKNNKREGVKGDQHQKERRGAADYLVRKRTEGRRKGGGR